MLFRKIDAFLDVFFHQNNKALLLTGARQVGKTFSIRQFAKRKFENFVEINFIESPEAKRIFLGAKDTLEILLRLSAYTNQDITKHKTLFFFDEVQECPEVVTLIKFLVSEGSHSYILSGSLLGVELKSLRSEPVGYMDIKEMYPMDFEEFAIALGVSNDVLNHIKNGYHNLVPVDDFIHNRMMALFRLYIIIGGMPAAVNKYIETNNMQVVVNEQKSILRLYKRDIAKYDPTQTLYLDEIFNLIPSELNAKNKRFILKNLNENLKFSRYENSFLWLKNAGVALPTYNVEEPRIPLLLSKQRNLFKLFQSDIGLLTCQFAEGIQLQLLQDNVTINFGSVYENVTAQELIAHGHTLYYFNSKRQGELDFIIEDGNGQVLPIEVKSGKDYTRHSALSNVMKIAEYNISRAIVLCNENVHVKGGVIYLPIYMLLCISHQEVQDLFYHFDMTGLQ